MWEVKNETFHFQRFFFFLFRSGLFKLIFFILEHQFILELWWRVVWWNGDEHLCFVSVLVDANSLQLFTTWKIAECVGTLMTLKVGVWSVLKEMWKIITFFKVLMNFTLEDFEELATFVFITIMMNVKFTNEIHIVARHCQSWAWIKSF